MKKYNEITYTPLVPNSGVIGTTAFRFESPSHFISFVEDLETNNIRGSSLDSSTERGDDFSGTSSIEEAITLFRKTTFQPEDLKTSSVLVNKMRHRPGYYDDGDEIAIQEFLANDKYFIQFQNSLSKQKYSTFRFPLIIQGSYSCMTDQMKAYETIRTIINVLYQNRIRFPKIIFGINPTNLYNGCPDANAGFYVEIPYTDFNALAKMIHPSTFRRLWFRLVETNPHLCGSYGSNTARGSSIKDGIVLSDFIGKDKETIAKLILNLVDDYWKTKEETKPGTLPRDVNGDIILFDGMKLKVGISGQTYDAALCIDSRREFYICQNQKAGSCGPRMFGFSRSWSLGKQNYTTLEQLQKDSYTVSSFDFVKLP